MKVTDPCAVNALKFIDTALRTKRSVSFNDVIGSAECKRYSVSDIGKALELLRKNKLVKASSRFGCSELLEFIATAVTDEGRAFLKDH